MLDYDNKVNITYVYNNKKCKLSTLCLQTRDFNFVIYLNNPI